MRRKRTFQIHPWKIRTDTLEPEAIRLLESMTATGNGYMGLRGNFEEGYSGDSHKGTYLAGVWYPDKTKVGWWKIGYPDYFGKVINAVDFIAIDIFVNGQKIDLFKAAFKDFFLELDMRSGVVERGFTYLDENNGAEVRFLFQRFLSLVTLEASFQSLAVEVLAGSAKIEIIPRLNGKVQNLDSNYDEIFWEPQKAGADPYSFLTLKTIENPFDVPRFTITALMANKLTIGEQRVSCTKKQHIWAVQENFSFKLAAGEAARLEKTVVVLTSRDVSEEKQAAEGRALLDKICAKSFSSHRKAHSKAWEARWERADVEIKGDEEAQQGIRFNLFHLFQTYYGHDARLNIGPKGFTGEKYGGAAYWDTEAFIFPLYLAVTGEEVAKQLLHYRHRHLPQAVENAAKLGLKGALYPMVTLNGEECHNEWEITFEEIHRNGSMAYAIYNYTNYTGNDHYLKNYGIDVLVAISRFWADRVHFSKPKGQYMLHGVTGPNEYENNVNNNWFTNYIAKWTLLYTLESLQRVDQRKKEALKVTEGELKKWAEIAELMYLPADKKRGIFVQHDTFLDKELLTTEALDPQDLPLNQNWSWDRILRSCFIKQADVLQGLYYFPDDFSKEELAKNFDFYEPMTVHESSLSPSIHCVLACWLGREEKAVELYNRTARLDLDNYNNDTQDGLHITSMSGSWLCIVQGFAGMRVSGDRLSFWPFCPQNWTGYTFKILFRGRLLQIGVEKEKAFVTLLKGDPLQVGLYDKTIDLKKENTPRVVVKESK